MTTEIQIEGLTLKLRTDSALPLIVKDQSVVAIFEDPTTKKKDSLGQVSDRNGCSDILRLSIGVNQKTSRLFITLAIWIRTGRVRNKNKSKGRLMFLVVPAESLALETAFDDHDAIVKQFPGISFESPSDDKSRKHKLMRMSFVMESMRSHVIMPQYKRQANAKGQQMALLRKLRSLSESDKFQLVANYDEATSTAIQNVCKTLSQTAITPSVILEELYSSKQSGCIDEWVKQGWCARDSTNLDVVGNPKDFETVNVPQHTLDPPQYELRAPSFEELFSSRSKNCIGLQASLGLAGDHSLQTSPCLPSTAPPYSTCAELDSYPYETAYQHASAVTPDSHGTPGHAMVTHSDYAEIFSIPPSEDPLTPMPTSSDYIGTFLSGFSSCPNSAPIVPLGHGKSRSSIDQSVQEKTCSSFRRSSKDPSARVQIPATSPRYAVTTFVNSPGDVVSPIPDSLTRKRRLSQSRSNEMARPATRPFSTDGVLGSCSLRMHEPCDILSNTVADSLSYSRRLTEPNQDAADHDQHSVSQKASLLSLWLLEAWKQCPVAHHVLAVELLEFATAINHSICEEDVTTCRVACTLALLDHCTREGSTDCPHASLEIECNFTIELRTLTAWLYKIHPMADMEFFSSLTQLSLLVKQLQVGSLPNHEYSDLLHRYKQQKAEVVSQVCLRYSDELLQRGSEAVISNMLE